MSNRTALHMTQAQVDAHNAKHGFKPGMTLVEVFQRERERTEARATRRMTQAEREYELILKAEHPDATILFEAYTLRLAHDCRYTPDFAVVRPFNFGGGIDFYEVKGSYIFPKALVKPRVAAEKFPWHRFYLAQKTDHGWDVTQLRAS